MTICGCQNGMVGTQNCPIHGPNPYLDIPLSPENPGALRRTREEYKADLLAIGDKYPLARAIDIAHILNRDPSWVAELLWEARRERSMQNNVGAFI